MNTFFPSPPCTPMPEPNFKPSLHFCLIFFIPHPTLGTRFHLTILLIPPYQITLHKILLEIMWFQVKNLVKTLEIGPYNGREPTTFHLMGRRGGDNFRLNRRRSPTGIALDGNGGSPARDDDVAAVVVGGSASLHGLTGSSVPPGSGAPPPYVASPTASPPVSQQGLVTR
jgi:hypothetical protein